jgi:cardiolipin synthase
VPVFATAFLYGERYLAAGLFLAAAITDVLDGYIARISRKETKLGALLDPLADKLLLLSAFGLLAYRHDVPFWAMVIVISKEVVVVGGWMLRNFITRRSSAVPSFLGKVATVGQVAAVAVYLTGDIVPAFAGWESAVLYAAMVLTAMAGLGYLYRGLRELE